MKEENKLPTKEQIMDYLNEDKRLHTPYSASVYFNIPIEKVYEITGI